MTTIDRIAAVMHCTPADDDDLVEAVRLLVAERDAAVAARDALAGAVREEREAVERAGIEHNALVDANDYAERRLYGWETRLRVVSERHRKAVNARIAATDRITALVDAALTATPVAMVRADVVRAYLATADAYDDAGLRALEDDEVDDINEGEARDAARTALDAALAAAGGAR